MKKFQYYNLNAKTLQQIEMKDETYTEIISEFKTIENYLRTMIHEDILVTEVNDNIYAHSIFS